MIDRFRMFIRELRKKDERVKRAWVLGASAVSMAAIVLLWIAYLSFVIPSIAPETPPAKVAEHSAPAASSTGSAWETLKRGFGALSGDAGAKWKSLSETVIKDLGTITDQFSRRNEITAEPSSTPYLPNEPAEPIPPTPLP